MKKYKFFFGILLSIALFSGLISCNKTPSEPPITKEALGQYICVRAQDSSSECYKAMLELRSSIKEKCSVSMSMANDMINTLSPVTEYEILMGNTNREESQAFMSLLKYGEYGYALINGKIVISGYDDEATIKAIEAFMTDIIDNYDGSIFYTAESNKLYKAQFPVEELKINGFDISEYNIVYNEVETNYELFLAKKVQSAIMDACGIKIEIKTSAEPYESGKKEIIIGNNSHSEMDTLVAVMESVAVDSDDELSFIYSDGNDIVWLAGNTFAGINNAIIDFIDRITPAESVEVHDVSISGGAVLFKD